MIFEFIKELLATDGGSFAFVAILLCLAFYLTHWVTKKITEITESHKNIERENQKVTESIEKVSEKLSSNMDDIRKDISFLKGTNEVFNSNINAIKTDVSSLKEDISFLKGMNEICGKDPYAQSHSPISLTELGKKVSAEIGVDDMIQRNWNAIVNDIDKNAEGKSAYDIQQYCIETTVVEPERFLLPEDIKKLKDYAYNQGRPIVAFAQIFAITIRDKYLKEKGINIEEIDKTTP